MCRSCVKCDIFTASSQTSQSPSPPRGTMPLSDSSWSPAKTSPEKHNSVSFRLRSVKFGAPQINTCSELNTNDELSNGQLQERVKAHQHGVTRKNFEDVEKPIEAKALH